MQFAISSSEQDGHYLMQVMGEVDVSCADEFRASINEVLERSIPEIEVDLSEVSYIDSTGIGVLVGAAHRALESGHSLVVSHPQRNVARVLELLGVAEELGLSDEEE